MSFEGDIFFTNDTQDTKLIDGKDQESFPTITEASALHMSKIEIVAVTQIGENVLTEPGNSLFLEKEGRTQDGGRGYTARKQTVSLCTVNRLAAFIFPLPRGKASCSLSLQRAAVGTAVSSPSVRKTRSYNAVITAHRAIMSKR